VIGRVPADRPRHRRRECAGAAESGYQHQRVRPAFGDRPGGLALDGIGIDGQAGGQQGPVTLLADVAEDGVALWLELEHDHLRQRRG